MAKITEKQVWEGLAAVKLPAQKQNVVEAQLVSRLDVQEESVFIEYRLPQLNSMFEKSLRYQTEKALKSIAPKLQVAVEFIEAAGGQDSSPAQTKAPALGSIIAVGSGKGGVGKSSVTVNLAMALKNLKYRVGILDCDVYGPSIPTMMGVEGQKPMMLEGKIQPIEAHGIKLMSAGFFIEEGQGLVWRGPMIHKLIQQFYADVNWDATDVLLIDLPPGTGDAPLSISQTMPLTGAILVSLPQKVSLVDVKRAHAMFGQVNIPVLGLIENMSHFVCPSCETESEIFSRGGAADYCKSADIPYLGDIPIDPKLRELCDQGKPYLLDFAETAGGQAFMKVAEGLKPLIRTADDRESSDLQIVL